MLRDIFEKVIWHMEQKEIIECIFAQVVVVYPEIAQVAYVVLDSRVTLAARGVEICHRRRSAAEVLPSHLHQKREGTKRYPLFFGGHNGDASEHPLKDNSRMVLSGSSSAGGI